ncbi:DUF2793 domain-containing protein [Stakelama tenebrarum]|nr:DUF2793 domain-containing protein [Sphingosinithalassobacter tenebrarum]
MSHNEALMRIDIVCQAMVTAAGIDAPPAAPGVGECWVVGTEPTGDWAEHPGAIACWTEGGWRFVAPREGMTAWVTENPGTARFRGGAWETGTVHGRLLVGGVQTVGARQPAIADPSGGATIDTEARTVVAQLLSALREHGLIEPD